MAADDKAADDALRQALREADALFAFAISSDRHIPNSLIEKIVESRAKLKSGTANSADEIAFWSAYNDLAARMAPITADSLACFKASPEGKVVAAWATHYIRRWTWFFLAVLVLSQIYWLIGTTMVRDAERLTFEWLSVKQEVARVLTVAPNVANAPVIEPLQTRLWILQNRIATNCRLMSRWNAVWSAPVGVPMWLIHEVKSWFGEGQSAPEEASTCGTIPPVAATGKTQVPSTGSAEDGAGETLRSDEEQMARIALQSLALYILPLLYGLLGAYTFVLRRLNTQIEEYTYTSDTLNRYRVRLTLGAVAGPTIGLFFTSENALSLTAQISPFAISFVAGYSVDVLFSALDRLIRAWRTSMEKDRPPEQREGLEDKPPQPKMPPGAVQPAPGGAALPAAPAGATASPAGAAAPAATIPSAPATTPGGAAPPAGPRGGG